MKTFLIILALAYASAEKLDLTYLPPPGSQYSGGRPEDIQVPLEYPKDTYSTTLRPQGFDGAVTNPEEYQATIGINRGVPAETLVTGDVAPGTKGPFSHRVPTTTVSYAFTQTTTHPPTEGFETTIVPQTFSPGFPSQDAINGYQPQEPTYQGNRPQDNRIATQFGGQTPTAESVSQNTGYPDQPYGSIDNQQAQNLPGYQLNNKQFIGQRPATPTSGPVSQYTGSTTQPQDLNVYRPGYEANRNQFREQNPTLSPISGQGKYPVRPTQNSGIVSRLRPEAPFGQDQYQNQTLNENGFVNQPSFVPSTVAPGFISTTKPSSTYGNTFDNIQGSSTPRPYSPQAGFPNQVNGQNINNEEAYQVPNSGLQPGGLITGPNRQNVFRPSTTFAPTTYANGIDNQQFPTGTSIIPEASYPTPGFPEGQYNGQVNGAPGVYSQRPERPQAEADRNAVILNYDNIITPEGYFAYSFDTSNGIHADENGTAADGVKAEGSYSYIGDDGKLYSIVYTADENGYQPRGDHLPTPPPIPKAIQEVIEKVQKEKEAGIYHDGSYDDDKYGYKKYQGAMRYGPQKGASDAEIPEEYVTETKKDMKLRRPFTGFRKPVVSSGDLSDFTDESNQEQAQYENDDDKAPGQVSTKRPINRVTIPEGDEEDSYIQDGDHENQFVEVSSKIPLKQPVRKLLKPIKGLSTDKTGSTGVRIRPSDRTGSKIEDQGSLEYGSEEPTYEDDINNTRASNKGVSRRPINQKRPQYSQEDVSITDDLEYDDNAKIPLAPGSFRRPAIQDKNKNVQEFDNYEVTKPTGRLPGRRPENRPAIGNIEDKYQPGESYTESYENRVPTNEPDNDASSENDDYEREESVTKLPTRVRPGGKRPSGSLPSRDKTIASRVRPSIPKGQSQEYEPVTGKPNRTFGGQYVENEKIYDKTTPQTGYYDRPEGSSSVKYDRPQTSGPRGRPQIVIQDDRDQVLIGDQRPSRPGAKFGQKLTRPKTNQQSVNYNGQPVNETGYQYIPPRTKFEQDKVKGFPNQFTGTTRVPSTVEPTKQNGFYKKEGIKSKPFLTPNVTPNDKVLDEYDQEEGTPDFVSDKNLNQDQFDNDSSQYPDSGTTPDETFVEEGITSTTPSRKFTSTSRRPSSTTGRPLRPQYNQNTQNIPGFVNDRVTPTGYPRPTQDSRFNQNKFGTNAPYQGASSTTSLPSTPSYYGSTTPGEQSYVNGDRTYTPGEVIVSSTTPVPSQNPIFGGYSQQNTNRPQIQTTFRPDGTLSPTTGYYDGSTAPRFPTGSSTYSPSNVGSNKNPQYGSDLPSTTYRPHYKIPGINEPSATAVPGVVVDGFGRPIRPGFSSTAQDYAPGSTFDEQGQPIKGQVDGFRRPVGPGFSSTAQDYAPGSTFDEQGQPIKGQVDGFGRPVRPGFSSTAQDYTPGTFDDQGQPIKGQDVKVGYQPGKPSSDQFKGQQRYQPSGTTGQRVSPVFPSTTEKIYGEDFSGPKQQQKFDPETGYYY